MSDEELVALEIMAKCADSDDSPTWYAKQCLKLIAEIRGLRSANEVLTRDNLALRDRVAAFEAVQPWYWNVPANHYRCVGCDKSDHEPLCPWYRDNAR